MTEPNAPLGTLMTLVIALLAPMFLGVTGGNVTLARAAAMETVNDYRARNSVSLIAIVQIIAFGLAAVGSLSLSMDDDVSVKMALRLRGNANACNRSAEQNRRALQAAQTLEHTQDVKESALFQDAISANHEPEEAPEGPAEEADLFLTQDAERMLAEEAQARLHHNPVGHPSAPAKKSQAKTAAPSSIQQAWAADMVKQADNISASIPHLPPDQREAAGMRATALSTTASTILCAAAAPMLQNAGARPASQTAA